MSAQPVNPALIAPVGATAPAAPAKGAGGPGSKPGSSFADALDRASGVKFSGHALQRVERRGIDTSPQTLARLDGAGGRAGAFAGAPTGAISAGLSGCELTARP